jgi:hypothetical protein
VVIQQVKVKGKRIISSSAGVFLKQPRETRSPLLRRLQPFKHKQLLPIHYAKSVHPHKTVSIAYCMQYMRKMHNIAAHSRSLPRSRTCTVLFLSDRRSGKQGHWSFCVGLRFMRYAILGATCSRPRVPFEISTPKQSSSNRQGKARQGM